MSNENCVTGILKWISLAKGPSNNKIGLHGINVNYVGIQCLNALRRNGSGFFTVGSHCRYLSSHFLLHQVHTHISVTMMALGGMKIIPKV